MRQLCYSVSFIAGGLELVRAWCESEAIILAQAERIKKGLDYKNISEITVVD